MQYHSMLAEAAADISGGQKQRLFIARALYHAPRVLFLDEATSHLDAASEALVTRAVEAMDMTRVLVAHRKETIAIADRVLALDPATGSVARRCARRASRAGDAGERDVADAVERSDCHWCGLVSACRPRASSSRSPRRRTSSPPP